MDWIWCCCGCGLGRTRGLDLVGAAQKKTKKKKKKGQLWEGANEPDADTKGRLGQIYPKEMPK